MSPHNSKSNQSHYYTVEVRSNSSEKHVEEENESLGNLMVPRVPQRGELIQTQSMDRSKRIKEVEFRDNETSPVVVYI